MVETAKTLNKRSVEVARLMAQYRKDNGGLDGWELFLSDWAEKRPLFAGVTPPAVPAPGARPAAAPGLPPSDADIRRQNAPPGSPNGGIIPGPKRFDLGGAKAAPLPAPEAIQSMDRGAIEALSPRVSEMTDDQLMALHARRRQLLGIGGAP